jgi:hypothetical protein
MASDAKKRFEGKTAGSMSGDEFLIIKTGRAGAKVREIEPEDVRVVV